MHANQTIEASMAYHRLIKQAKKKILWDPGFLLSFFSSIIYINLSVNDPCFGVKKHTTLAEGMQLMVIF